MRPYPHHYTYVGVPITGPLAAHFAQVFAEEHDNRVESEERYRSACHADVRIRFTQQVIRTIREALTDYTSDPTRPFDEEYRRLEESLTKALRRLDYYLDKLDWDYINEPLNNPAWND